MNPKIHKSIVLFGLVIIALLAVAILYPPSSILALAASAIGYCLSAIGLGGAVLAAAPVVLTEDQVTEFKSILDGLREYKDMFPKLKQSLPSLESLKSLPDSFKALADENSTLKADLGKLRKHLLSGNTGSGVRWVGSQPFVTDDCARALAAMYVVSCYRQDKWPKAWGESSAQERALGFAQEALAIQGKAALTGNDIPLPIMYIPQVVELIWKYGQFRQYATVFPLGAPTVNLPQLKPGEDDFGIVAVSAAVPERKVAAQNITFTAQKVGGIIRIPTEIEEDTFIPLGQFLARYVSRRFAAFEDKMGFMADGSATYATRQGVCLYAISQNPVLGQVLAGGKTKPTDATVNDFRLMRRKVNAAVFGMTPAYYMHPSMEALLVTFNTINQPLIYRPAQGGQPATLDGFPIRWTAVFQAYDTVAAAGTYLAAFGELSYWYLGERMQPRVETSREVYFATDEIGLRAIERIDVQPLAPDAMTALQTAAA